MKYTHTDQRGGRGEREEGKEGKREGGEEGGREGEGEEGEGGTHLVAGSTTTALGLLKSLENRIFL